ncbi:hypothetical protein FNL56_13475 [Tardiphaga sp. vice304]|uniref:hypothetical protein n=1 Tax=Tardiphaga sp. vice304 TaxID=2592817 RepID=UPI0011627EE4|nr:hypothetical protein [Tardiphaga sp. vice304]QDM27011.1 hypothetical protein FNL56_13475 [Tardiphaga sp. vice304]
MTGAVQIFAKLSAAGLPLAFYRSDVNDVATIPSECIELSDAQWLEFINNNGLRKWSAGAVVAYEPPAPAAPDAGTIAPQLIASALSVNIVDGDVASVDGIFGLAGAIYLGVGQYMLLFLTSQPDTNFYAVIGGGAPCMSSAEKDVDYLTITATDAAGGQPVDAAQFNVQIFRI